MRRLAVSAATGAPALLVAWAAGARWSVSVLIGWDVATVVFMTWVWVTIGPMDAASTKQLALSEDDSRAAADTTLLSASVASLVAVGLTLAEASKASGAHAVLLTILGVLSIPASMRVARAATLTLSRREFVIAAQALGASHARILLRELLPNVILPLFAFFLLGVAVIIVVEGALSFLGLGVPPPMSSWGSMIGEGRESLEVAPRLAFLPAAAMFLTVLSFNLVGDTLRALTDPRQGAL